MPELTNIYCDESCHLENDGQSAMTLGAVWCPAASARQIADDIRGLKTTHGMGRQFESKWTKVSPGGLPFYQALLDYFFENPDLHFRAVVAAGKSGLRHADFGQTHDDWYYKMYFQLLSVILLPSARYAIYLDIKDTRSGPKLRKLHEVLCNNLRDFDRERIRSPQTVGSREVQQVQLTDLLTGIVSAASRGVTASTAKRALIQRMQSRSGCDITRSTPRTADKVNIFRWDPREAQA
jgi:hypothetical protein